MAVNPANALGAKHGAGEKKKDRFLAYRAEFFSVAALSFGGSKAADLLTRKTYMTSVGKCGPASDVYMNTICWAVAHTVPYILS